MLCHCPELGQAVLFGITIWFACIISAPFNEWSGSRVPSALMEAFGLFRAPVKSNKFLEVL